MCLVEFIVTTTTEL